MHGTTKPFVVSTKIFVQLYSGPRAFFRELLLRSDLPQKKRPLWLPAMSGRLEVVFRALLHLLGERRRTSREIRGRAVGRGNFVRTGGKRVRSEGRHPARKHSRSQQRTPTLELNSPGRNRCSGTNGRRE